MRCPACEYPLWNLPPGPCPECGRPFRSDEFEFDRGSVAFLCAKCGQEYFGTDAKGLLLPRAFECVRCGAACVCGEMAVAPTDRIDPLAARNPLPWLDRGLDEARQRRRGFFNRFFATFWAFTSRGWKEAEAVPRSAPTGPAWWFAAIVAVLASLLQFAPLTIFPLITIAGMRNAMPPGSGELTLWVVGMAVAFMLAAAVLSLLLAGLGGLLTHGVLRLSGPTEAGLGRTMQAILYPSGVLLWGSIPLCCFGGVGAFVWWIVLCCGTVKKMQGVSWVRSCLAVLLSAVPVWSALPVWFVLTVVGGLRPPAVLPPPMPAPPAAIAPAASTDDASELEPGEVESMEPRDTP